jgi:hypothetical protein
VCTGSTQEGKDRPQHESDGPDACPTQDDAGVTVGPTAVAPGRIVKTEARWRTQILNHDELPELRRKGQTHDDEPHPTK